MNQEDQLNIIDGCMDRLSAMEGHVVRFAQSPWDTDNLKKMAEHFTGIAELTESNHYSQLSEMSNIAKSGQHLCSTIIARQPDDVIVYWRSFKEMVTQIRSMLEAEKERVITAPPEQEYMPPPSLVSSGTAIGAPPPSQSRESNYSQPQTQPPSHSQHGSQNPNQIQAHAQVQQSEIIQQQQPQQQAQPAPPIIPTHDVVVISTNLEKLRALSTALSHQAISVRPCSDLNQAWETTLNHLPDGLLVCVPVHSGNAFQFISQVRSLPGGENIAIIVLAEEHGFLESINTVKARADAFLALPVEIDAILEKFRYFFGRGKPQLYRILCSEQDPHQAQSIVSILEGAGYNVVWQKDPFSFEESLLALCPDLILLDASSSDITGFELARYVRQSERFATVPVIFLASENDLAAHLEGARSLADDYLIKPVIPELLVATVAGKLERFRIFQKLLKNDSLTQVLNFNHFVEQAQRSLKARANLPSSGSSRAVLTVIDIDNFKGINNTFGFSVGDRTLLALVQIIRKVFRHTDLIGRVGPDRIGILDYGLPLRETIETVDDLLLNFAQVPHKSQGNIFKVTAGAGICQAMEHERFGDLLSRTLISVQNAKFQGKGRICQG